MSDQPMEFYGSVQIMPVSNPATDPLQTVRMQPPDTWARRYDGNTLRVAKMDNGDLGWREIGDHAAEALYPWHTNDDVADWPVQHPLVWSVAYDRLAGKVPPPPAGKASTAPELKGDMGVESFRGGES